MNHFYSNLFPNKITISLMLFFFVSTCFIFIQTSYATQNQLEGSVKIKVEKMLNKITTNIGAEPSKSSVLIACIANVNSILSTMEPSQANFDRLPQFYQIINLLKLSNREKKYIADQTFNQLAKTIRKKLNNQPLRNNQNFDEQKLSEIQNLTDDEFNIWLQSGEYQKFATTHGETNLAGELAKADIAANNPITEESVFPEHNAFFGKSNDFRRSDWTISISIMNSWIEDPHPGRVSKELEPRTHSETKRAHGIDEAPDKPQGNPQGNITAASNWLENNNVTTDGYSQVSTTRPNLDARPFLKPLDLSAPTMQGNVKNEKPVMTVNKKHNDSEEAKELLKLEITQEIEQNKKDLESVKKIALSLKHDGQSTENYISLKRALTGFFLNNYWFAPLICKHPENPDDVDKSCVDTDYEKHHDVFSSTATNTDQIAKHPSNENNDDLPTSKAELKLSCSATRQKTSENPSLENDFFKVYETKKDRETALNILIEILINNTNKVYKEQLSTPLKKLNETFDRIVLNSNIWQDKERNMQNVLGADREFERSLCKADQEIPFAVKTLFSNSCSFLKAIVQILGDNTALLIDSEVITLCQNIIEQDQDTVKDKDEVEDEVELYFKTERALLYNIMAVGLVTPGEVKTQEDLFKRMLNHVDSPIMIFTGFHWFLRKTIVNYLVSALENALKNNSACTEINVDIIDTWISKVQFCHYFVREIIGTCDIEKCCLLPQSTLSRKKFKQTELICKRNVFYSYAKNLWQDLYTQASSEISTNEQKKEKHERIYVYRTHRKILEIDEGQFCGKNIVFNELAFIRRVARLQKKARVLINF